LISAAVLNSVYRNAKDADIRERILLITRVRLDKNEASSVAEKNSIDLDGGLTNGSDTDSSILL
jgi:hypothetical protein